MKYKFQPYIKSKIERNHLHLGGSNPKGERIDVNSIYLERAGKPWIAIMGEYHFSRDKKENWYKELCKMKAGGMTTVATYVMWIYHEEIEGEFNFKGDNDVHAFILEAKKAGLDVVLRIGPWAHGECRNGGFPDWLLEKDFKLRDNNTGYMEKVKIFYERIYNEVRDLFYKDGGNIVAVQVENELVDNAEHLLELKKLAIEIGFDAPIWTVTGWNSVFGAKIPVDDVLPVFGAYPEAPWTRHINKLPLSMHYVFNKMRNDSAIGLDLIKKENPDGWQLPYEKYPFATCEIGGGIQVTHHRRPYIIGMDIYALSLCKLGSGNNLIGYYMYKGGTNKIGKLSTLNETKASGYPNDYTTISYDFQTMISEFGEIREQYRLTNMMHMFVNEFGNILAPMESVMSEKEVNQNDFDSLRYAMRTDGESGFVFVNHYQRLAKLNKVKAAVIETGSITFPPIDVDGDISFILPFNIPLGNNILEYATAQPLCRVGDVYFFAEINGIKPDYKFKNDKKAKIVTLTWNEARFARLLNNELYIGENCDLYYDGEIKCVEDGTFKYKKWNGNKFEKFTVNREFNKAELIISDYQGEYVPSQTYELNINGTRKLSVKKISATTAEGFLEIPFECDCSQIYIDGILVADNFYYGKPWRIPASLIYDRDAVLVMSEIKNDFYREV